MGAPSQGMGTRRTVEFPQSTARCPHTTLSPIPFDVCGHPSRSFLTARSGVRANASRARSHLSATLQGRPGATKFSGEHVEASLISIRRGKEADIERVSRLWLDMVRELNPSYTPRIEWWQNITLGMMRLYEK